MLQTKHCSLLSGTPRCVMTFDAVASPLREVVYEAHVGNANLDWQRLGHVTQLKCITKTKTKLDLCIMYLGVEHV